MTDWSLEWFEDAAQNEAKTRNRNLDDAKQDWFEELQRILKIVVHGDVEGKKLVRAKTRTEKRRFEVRCTSNMESWIRKWMKVRAINAYEKLRT